MIEEKYAILTISFDSDLSHFYQSTDFPFNIIVEKGKIAKVGRFRNRISPVTIVSLGNEETNYSLDNVLNIMVDHKKYWNTCKDISLNLYVKYTKQCNFTLQVEQLKKISKLNIDLQISCWETKCLD